MKILFITDLYPVKSDEINTPKTLFNFVKEWEIFGHEVDIIKPNFILNSFWRGKPFYKTGKYGKVLNLNYWTPFWFNVRNKYKFSTEEYDVVIAHMPSGILFADKLKIPFTAGIHNSDLTVLKRPFYKFHFKNRLEKALKNSESIACRSFIIKNKLLNLYPEFKEKLFTAPSGVDEKIIKERFENFNQNDLKIVTCGNFIKRKNIDKVIKACKDIKNINLTVIGDGKLKNELKKLDKNVHFTGRLKPDQVYKVMQNNDIFILPSVNETFGMVYLEAMASGCITICTENDGIDGIIIDKENGFLVKPDIKSIKNLILNIKNMDENKLNLIRKSSYNTISEYTSEKCAQNYLNKILKFRKHI